jgi:hypothetical protein
MLIRRLLAFSFLIAGCALAGSGTAAADAEHASPPASMRCPDGMQLLPLSHFEEFGLDFAYIDLNGNGFLCGKALTPFRTLVLAIDDVAFASAPSA